MKSLLGFVLAAFCAASARAGTIGLFTTPEALSCDLSVPPDLGFGTFYVCAQSSTPEETCGGIGGAEFRIEGLPAGWSVVATPSSAANVVIGDPFGTGVNIAFPIAMPWDASSVVLYTVAVYPPSPGATSVLRVTPHSEPVWEYPCPNVSGACFDQWVHCLQGGTLFINSSVPCAIGVQKKLWSDVKSLFR